MKHALINPEKCKACEACAIEEGCPHKAILKETAAEKPWVDSYKCVGCMRCKSFCRNRAVLETHKPCGGRA